MLIQISHAITYRREVLSYRCGGLIRGVGGGVGVLQTSHPFIEAWDLKKCLKSVWLTQANSQSRNLNKNSSTGGYK